MILYLAITTIVLSVVQAVYNYKINRNSIYLAGYLILISLLGLLHLFSVYPKSSFYLAIIYGHFMPLFYLAGPMLFFYIRGTLKDNSKLSKWDLIHFLPALIGLVSIFPYYFEPFNYKLDIANQIMRDINTHKRINISWLYNNAFNLPARTILLFFYAMACLIMTIRYTLKNKYATLSKQKKITLHWLYIIILIAIAGSINYLILNYIFFSNSDLTHEIISSYDVNFYVGITFSLVPVLIVVSPKVLYGLPVTQKNSIQATDYLDETIDSTDSVNSEETEQIYFQNLTTKAMEYLQKEKPFVNPHFSLAVLAEKLDVPKHHLYYCFNTVLKTKFTTVRTQMRVDYAKECLLNGDLNKLSMEGIWYKAGFSSKTNFFVSFKEVTQMTPLDFIKINQLET